MGSEAAPDQGESDGEVDEETKEHGHEELKEDLSHGPLSGDFAGGGGEWKSVRGHSFGTSGLKNHEYREGWLRMAQNESKYRRFRCGS